MISSSLPTPSLIIFCANPLTPQQPDELYATEFAAAQSAGFACALISYESLVDEDNPVRAIRRIPLPNQPTPALYRGWMLRPWQYARLYHTLLDHRITLINDPTAYQHTHYLPESYEVIKDNTPLTRWLHCGLNITSEQIIELVQPFGDHALIVKDFVISQKHHWLDACYIPSAADHNATERVIRRFLELQGPDLNEGVVVREFVELAPLAIHPRSGMPLTQEYRIFFLDGEPISIVTYWEEGEYSADTPPLNLFTSVAQQVRSRFFTMDVARQSDGRWIIVELGDGQVAGLPERANPTAFYAALYQHLHA